MSSNIMINDGTILINKYKIDRKIGSGGMGEVFRAYTRERKVVAIKRMFGTKEVDQKRFKREYEFLKAVDHPNLLKAYDYFEQDGDLFMVLQFITGKSMREYLKAGYSFDLLEKIAIASKAARAVEVLNTGGIIHRDLKPDNIMIDNKTGEVYIIDLGVGKNIDVKQSALTMQGAVIGTLAYMSPEQTENAVGEQSDVFSLGVVLYQFFLELSESPFAAPAYFTILMNIAEHHPEKVYDLLESKVVETEKPFYKKVSDLIALSMEKDPLERCNGCRALADGFANIQKAYMESQKPQKVYNRSLISLSAPLNETMMHTLQEVRMSQSQISDLQKRYADYKNKQAEQVGSKKSVNEEVNRKQDIHVRDSGTSSDSPSKETLPSATREKLGDYEIIEEIARGGMGIVYKAYDSKLNRQVALKVLLHGEKALSVEGKRFLREAQASANLKHPNIIDVYNVGQVDQTSFIAMQYIEGETFEHFLEGNKGNLKKRLSIFQKVCKAVSFVHKNNATHRDIKPANILLDKTNTPYLSDFGLVRIDISEESLTQTGSLLGTPSYMSPEQIQGQKRLIGPASDIYSLGVLLYFILTDELPFTAENFIHLSKKVTQDPVVFPTDLNISSSFQAICQKAMAKKIKHRYSSIKELQDDLEKISSGQKTGAERDRVYSRVKAIGVSIIIFSLLAFFTYFIVSKQSQPRQQNVKQLLANAESFIQKKDFAQAQTNLEKALSKKPDSLEILMLLSNILYKQTPNEKQEELRLYWVRILQHDNVTSKHLNTVVEQAFSLGDFAIATEGLSQILAQDSKDIVARQKIFRLNLVQGQFSLARKHLQNLTHDQEAFRFGEAVIHYQESRYDQLDYCLASASLPPQENLNKSLYSFLRGCSLWQEYQVPLSDWRWIHQTSNEHSDHLEKNLLIKQTISKIEQHFQDAESILKETTPSYYSSWQQELLAVHRYFLKFETAAPDTDFHWLEVEQKLSSQSLSLQVSFSLSVLRFLVRAKKWEQAEILSRKFAQKYSWNFNIHHLRAVILERLGHRYDAKKSIQQAIFLNRSNYLATSNYTQLLMEDLNQENFRLATRLIFYQNEKNKAFVLHQFFVPYMNKARQQIAQSKELKRINASSSFLWETVFKSKSKASVQAAIKMIKSLPLENIKQQIEKHGFRLKNIYPKHYEDLRQTRRTLQKELKKREARQKLLDCYSDALAKEHSQNQDQYIKDFSSQKTEGEDILEEILTSPEEQPIIRMLAAKVLAAIPDDIGDSRLQRRLRSSYPVNVLAQFALEQESVTKQKKSSDSINLLAQFATKPNLKVSEKDLREGDLLFRLLFAFATPISGADLSHDKFIKSQEENVVLIRLLAARYQDIHHSKLIKVLPFCSQLFQSKDSFVRKITLQVFLELWSRSVYKAKTKDRKDRTIKTWRSYGNNIVQCLRDPSREIRVLAAISTLKYSRVFLLLAKQTDKNWLSLQGQLNKNLGSPFINLKVASACALGTTNPFEKITKHVYGDGDYFPRFAMSWGILSQQQKKPNLKDVSYMFNRTRKYVSSPVKDENDKCMKQLILLSIAATSTRGNKNPVVSKFLNRFNDVFRDLANHKNKEIQTAYAAALLWKGNEKDISVLYKMFSGGTEPIKLVSSSSLAAVVSEYQPKRFYKLMKMFRSLQNSEKYFKSAAWSIYERAQMTLAYKASEEPFYSVYHFDRYLDQNFRNKFSPKVKRLFKHANEAYPTSDYAYELAFAYFLSKEYDRSEELRRKALRLLAEPNAEKKSRYPLFYIKSRCEELRGEILKEKLLNR